MSEIALPRIHRVELGSCWLSVADRRAEPSPLSFIHSPAVVVLNCDGGGDILNIARYLGNNTLV